MLFNHHLRMAGQGESSCAHSLNPVCVFVYRLFNELVFLSQRVFELPHGRKMHYKFIPLLFFIYTSVCFSKMCSDRNQKAMSFLQVWLLDIVFVLHWFGLWSQNTPETPVLSVMSLVCIYSHIFMTKIHKALSVKLEQFQPHRDIFTSHLSVDFACMVPVMGVRSRRWRTRCRHWGRTGQR